MKLNNKKFYNNNLVRYYNFTYNFLFKVLNNIEIDLTEDDIKFLKKKGYLNSKGLGTVWLLNLKRLYNIFKKKKFNTDYHFIDVGCGNGIPLIYSYKKFDFLSYSGFDFVSRYVKNSKKNIKNSINNPTKINVFKANAKNFLLDDKKSYFIFMFNPFDRKIMTKFLKNNIKILRKNKSVIAYVNCIHLKEILKFSRNITKVKKYKSAIIQF